MVEQPKDATVKEELVRGKSKKRQGKLQILIQEVVLLYLKFQARRAQVAWRQVVPVKEGVR